MKGSVHIVLLLLVLTPSTLAQDGDRYLLLATTRTQTMQKEIGDAAARGYRVVSASRTEGAEVIVALERATESYQYRLLATTRTGTLERELNEAAEAGYRVVPRTITTKRNVGSGSDENRSEGELLVIMERGPQPRPGVVYRVLATRLTGTLQREMSETADAGYTLLALVSRSEHVAIFERTRQETQRAGNPVLPGWYADPEAHIFAGRYWIHPTYSARYDDQTFLDAFSSTDLVTWTKHPRILDAANVSWATRAVWAPSIVEKDGRYYLFFSANDIQNDSEPGGLGVARASRPEGPFEDHLGRPLIDRFHNGAQPIDPYVFRDDDGTYYLIYGGWRHCNIAKLNADFTGFVPFDDGTSFKEITPQGYVEGSFMFRKDGKYYFMWSEGGWTGPNYAVAYAVADSPLGPFERVGQILRQDPAVATGAGHHSILHAPGSDRWFIVYHRRPLGETDRNHRVVCIDELHFEPDGSIRPVRITDEGVERAPIR